MTQDLDDLIFHFECFTEGEQATLVINATDDVLLEGPERIGFMLAGEATNIPGIIAFGNMLTITIPDDGKDSGNIYTLR